MMLSARLIRFLRFTCILAVLIFFITHQLVSKKEYQRVLELKAKLKDNTYDFKGEFEPKEDLSFEKIIYMDKSASEGYPREKACFFALARNEDLYNMANTVQSFEDRFNHRFKYDWVFVNDKPFEEKFKKQLSNIVSGNAYFEQIPIDYWTYPEWIDKKKAKSTRMSSKAVLYGRRESYRFMCRFYSGLFYKMDIMKGYDFAWRVEPDTSLRCDVSYDVFKFMRENDKKYGFAISIREFENTIPTLWKNVQNFIQQFPNYIAENNLYHLISNDMGRTYNLCHFWTNFEVMDLRFFRSQLYEHYFDYIDRANGFFYERWGDAPVISIAVSLFLNKNQVHFFDDIGYTHHPNVNCPIDDEIWSKGNCNCDQTIDVTFRAHSCTGMFYEAIGKKKPAGWESHVGV